MVLGCTGNVVTPQHLGKALVRDGLALEEKLYVGQIPLFLAGRMDTRGLFARACWSISSLRFRSANILFRRS